MKYIVYLTKNTKSKINGLNKIYIGVHQTKDPNIFDGYLGCGCYVNQPSTYMYPKTPFQYAVKKYGVDAFERTTLFIFDSEEEAYKKEEELVDVNFIKLSHVYNACLGGIGTSQYKPLYQFDLNGNLIKRWNISKEAYDFYNIPQEDFSYAIHHYRFLLDSIWSHEEKVDITKYTNTAWGSPEITHLYNLEGKWLGKFNSRKECAEYINSDSNAICKAIDTNRIVAKNYYVSNKLYDEFVPKKRKQYYKTYFYIYKESGELIGEGLGKEIMSIIGEHSWSTIIDVFRYKHNWYKDFYISEQLLDKVPEKTLRNKIKVDVYDKYGNFIECLESVKQVREKYKVPSSKIKNIERGDRYFNDFIFKYHSNR